MPFFIHLFFLFVIMEIHPLQHRYIVASALYVKTIQHLHAAFSKDRKALADAADCFHSTFPTPLLLGIKPHFESYMPYIGIITWDVDTFLQEHRALFLSVLNANNTTTAPYKNQYTHKIDAHLALIKDTHVALKNDIPTIQTHHDAMVAVYDALPSHLKQSMHVPFPLTLHDTTHIKSMVVCLASYHTPTNLFGS
jgi:hypothetical protein